MKLCPNQKRYPSYLPHIRLIVVFFCFALAATGVFSFAADPSQNPISTSGDQYSTAGRATSGLDASGKSIPKTNYQIPSGAIFVSPTGNDSNNGSNASAPVKTINRAVSLVPADGTIVMRGGEYRDWYNNNGAVGIVSKGLTFQAYPGESPWFNGADIVDSGWVTNGTNNYVHAWSTPSFCDGKYYNYSLPPYTPQIRADGSTDPSIQQTACMYEDASNDPNYPVSGDPQQVFINGVAQNEVGSLSKLTPGAFFYDWYNRNIHLGTNPAGKTVELSARPAAIVLAGDSNVTHYIKGIGFHRYATNGSEGTMTGSAVYFARRAIIENSIFSENATNGLVFSNPIPGTVVRQSVIAYNGGTGLAANGASKSIGVRNDLTIEGNIFNANNSENGGYRCNRACGPANIKLAHMTGFLFKDNIIENAYSRAPGVWCDQNCSDGKFINNIVRGNGGPGIFYEVSTRGIVAGNLVVDNDDAGILVGSSDTKIYNNTVTAKYVASGSRVQAIEVYDDIRTPPSLSAQWPWTSRDNGPNTSNIELVNNLIVGPAENTGPRLINTGPAPAPTYNGVANSTQDQYYSVFNNNMYYARNTQVLYAYINTSGAYKDGIKSPQDLRSSHSSAANFETTSLVVPISSAQDTPFVNKASGDLRLKSGSKALSMAPRSVPTDVASALGLPSQNPGVIGALTSDKVSNSNTTTTAPATTVATTKPTTTTTKPTTTTTKPTTTTTTSTLPAGQNLQLAQTAMSKMKVDYNLLGVRQLEWNNPVLKARAYVSDSWLYIAADVTVVVDTQGNYVITDVQWIASFTPIA